MHKRRELVPYCHDKRSSSGELNLASLTLTKQLLDLVIHRLDKTYVIVDGLDECDIPERKLIVSFFTSIVEKCDGHDPGKLRVLFVSQDYPDIRKAILAASTVSLTSSENRQDLETYVRNRSQEIKQKFQLGDSQTKGIAEKILARAKGNYVSTYLDSIKLAENIRRNVLIREVGHEQLDWANK